MKLVRWNPSRQLLHLQGDVDRLFGSLIRDLPGAVASAPVWAPAADVKESGEGFTLRLDLPGIRKEDLTVSVHGDTVTVYYGAADLVVCGAELSIAEILKTL